MLYLGPHIHYLKIYNPSSSTLNNTDAKLMEDDALEFYIQFHTDLMNTWI